MPDTRTALKTSAITEAKESSVIDNTFHTFVDLLRFFCVTYYPTLNFSRLSLQWNADGDDHMIMHVGGNWRVPPSVLVVSDRVDTEYCVVLKRRARRTVVNKLHLQFWPQPVISSTQLPRTSTDSSDIQLADRAVEHICANDERLKLIC
jgi:hypothetical protein